MNVFAAAIAHYLTSFNVYLDPLLHWGQWLFLSLLTINLIWMALWHAFDQDSFSQSMPGFIRKFFGIAVFYTIMIHPAWLQQLLQSAEFMGGTLTKTNLTPQAIIASGISLSNKLMVPLAGGNLLTGGAGFIIALLTALMVLVAFLAVALDLLITLIGTTLLISMASFFLGLSPQSESVARQTLNSILRNCMKLLGLYLVIAVGLQVMGSLEAIVPTQYTQLDSYVWISAVVLLFWFLAKALPRQLSEIIAEFIEKSGTALSSVNVPTTSLTLTTQQGSYSDREKTDSAIATSLIQSSSGGVLNQSMSNYSRATTPTGNLSAQFGKIIRKLAVTAKMPPDPKRIRSKQKFKVEK
jgi:P-type conjugative transfer protein TrbL